MSDLVKRERLEGKEIFIVLIRAYVFMIALRFNYTVAEGLETGSRIIDFATKIPNAMRSVVFEDSIIYAAACALMIFVKKREEKYDLWSMLLALLFGGLMVVKNACVYVGGFSVLFANIYQNFLTVLSVVGYATFFYSLIRVLYMLMEKGLSRDEKLISRPGLKGAAIIFACWLPWILMNYPCSFNPDSTSQLNQWLGLGSWSAHHPPLSTLIMGVCFSTGRALWNENFGCFLYVLLQSIIGSVVFSSLVSNAYEMTGSRKMYIAGILFYTATPFWGCFAQWFEKDLLYAETFTLCILLLLRILRKGECTWKDVIIIAIVGSVAVLLRKTGMYEIVPAIILAVLVVHSNNKMKVLCAAIAVMVISSGVNNVLYPALGVEEASVKEMLSIPFQQTARYVNNFPNEVTQEEHDAIDAVLVYDELDKYNPEISDFVKNNYRGKGDALPKYFKAWAAMLVKHPICYFEATFMNSYGVIGPTEPWLDGYIQSTYYPFAMERYGVYRVFGDFPTRVFDSAREIFIRFPVFNMFAAAWLYTWVLLICTVELIRKKKICALILMVPGVMNVLICIASPLVGSTRYELPLIAITPLIIAWTLMHAKTE